MHSTHPAKIVPAKNRNQIRKDAYRLRQKLGLNPREYVDIVSILELALPVVDPDFHVIIVDDCDLPGRYAEVHPYEHALYVKQSVYDAATRGGEWARMILAHELGHYYCHDPAEIRYAYRNANERLDPDIDPERQADIFAAEFLAPSGELTGMTPREVHKAFGVSMLAAKNQLQQNSSITRRHEQKRKKRSDKKSNR